MSAKRYPIGSPEWIKNYKARTKKARDKWKKKNTEKQIACVEKWKLNHPDQVIGHSKKGYANRKKKECGAL